MPDGDVIPRRYGFGSFTIGLQVDDGNGGTDTSTATLNVYAEQLVNTTTIDAQQKADVATDASGNYVVVWQDDALDGDGTGVFAQRYDAAGATVGVQFQVNTTTDEDQSDPRVAMDDAGNFVVTWSSEGQDGDADSETNIYARVYNAAGTAVTGEFLVNTITLSNQATPAIAMDGPTGEFIITWASIEPVGGEWNILARRFDVTGTPLEVDRVVNQTLLGDQIDPDISVDEYGEFSIVWTGFGQDGDGATEGNIYGQNFKTGGALQGGEFLINATTTGHQHSAAIAREADGDNTIVWVSEGQDGDGAGIFGESIAFGGSANNRLGEFAVNSITAGEQTRPDITSEPDGNFVVAWETTGLNGDGPTETNIYSRVFTVTNSGITPNAPDFLVNTLTAGNQSRPAIAADLEGDYVVAWDGNGPNDTDGVFSRLYSAVLTNTAPEISLANPNLSYTENDPPLIIGATLTVSDADSINLAGATVSFRSGFAVGEDVLSFTAVAGITGMYDAATGVLSFSGSASIADYRTVLRSVAYSNSSENPSAVQRQLKFAVDDGVSSSSDARKINVSATNDAPTANAGGVYSVNEGASISLDGTASNDVDGTITLYEWDLDYDGVTFNGTTTGATPTFNAATIDGPTNRNVALRVTDNQSVVSAVVTSTISINNVAPTANTDTGALFTTSEDSAFTTDNVLTNDTDPNPIDVLSVTNLDVTGTVGQVTDNGDGTFDYDPNGQFESLRQGQQTTDTFSYTVSDDDGGSDTAVVTVTINGANDAPTDVSLDNATVTEKVAGAIVGNLATVDPDSGDTHGYTVNDSRFEVVSNQLKLKAGQFLNFDVEPTVNLTITATDQGGGGLAFNKPFVITVVDVVDSAGVANSAPAAASTPESTPLVFSVSNGNAISVDDGSASAPVLRTTLSVTNGTLSLASTIGLTSVSGDGTTSVTVIGAESAINNALDGLAFTPTAFFNGSVNLQVTTDVKADLVAFYEFENSADLADDTSPVGSNDGSVTGSPTTTFDAARNSDVVVLDSVTDHLRFTGNRFGTPANVTVAAWVNANAVGNQEVISLGNSVVLRLNDSNQGAGVSGLYYNGSSWDHTNASTVVAGDGWHHVAYTVDDAARVQTLYIDGVVVSTTSFSSAISWTLNSNSTIGMHVNGSSYEFDGRLDDARIYGRALSASEIQAIANDGSVDTDVIAVSVTPVNDAPTDISLDNLSVTESVDGAVVGNLTTIDPDTGDSHTYAVDDARFEVVGAQLKLKTGQSLDFETEPTVSITVTTTDVASASFNKAFTISVNDVNEAPVLTTSAGTAAFTEDGAAVEIDNAIAVSDPENAGLTGAEVRFNSGFVSGQDSLLFTDPAGISGTYNGAAGVLTLSGSASVAAYQTALRSVTYSNASQTPNTANRILQFSVNDGTNVSSAARTLTVTAQDDAANVVTGGPYSVAEGGSVTLDGSASNDIDNSIVEYAWDFDYDGVTFNVDATGSSTNFSAAGIDGPDTRTVALRTRSDNGAFALATTTVTVTNVAPIASDNSGLQFTTDEGTSIVTANVLLNDNDPGPETLIVSSVDTTGTVGLVVDRGDGTFNYDPNGQFDSLAVGQSANDTFTYTVSDGTATDTATVTIIITGVNDAPVVNDQNVNVDENASLNSLVATATSTDVDFGDSVSWSIINGDPNSAFTIDTISGEIRVAKPLEFDFESTPSYSLTVRAIDQQGGIGTGNISVSLNNLNESPSISNATFSVDEDAAPGTSVGFAAGSDPDAGDILIWSILGGNTNGAFSLNASTGALTVASPSTLDFETISSYTLIVQIQDVAGLTDTSTVVVNVSDINEAPTTTGLADVTVNEDSANVLIDLTTAFADVETPSASLGYSVTGNSNPTLFSSTSISGGVLTLDLAPNLSGAATITVEASDPQGLTVSTSFNVTVLAVNDAPVASADSYFVEGQTLSVSATAGVLANDTDVEADTLTALLISGPANGSLTLQSDGSFVYEPVIGFNGADSFSYQTFDGTATSATRTVTLNVSGNVVAPPSTVDPGPSTDNSSASSESEADTETNNENDQSNDASSTINGVNNQSGPGGGQTESTVSEDNDSDDEGDEVIASDFGLTETNQDFFPMSLERLELRDATSIRTSVNSFDRSEDVSSDTKLNFQDSLRFDGEDLSYLVGTNFIKELEQIEEDFEFNGAVPEWAAGTAVATTASISVGYIMWMLRGGYVLASVLSTMPVWQNMDPLPVLAALDAADDDDDESLETMIDRASDEADDSEKPGTDEEASDAERKDEIV